MRIAVVGAGVAGLAAARALADAGRSVVVFDKGRGLGGRLSQRRTEGGAYDHGAQVIEAAPPALVSVLDAHGAPAWPDPPRGRIGVPSMNAVLKPLAEGLEIHRSARVGGLWRRDGWVLTDQADTSLGTFDRVVCAIPAPQARALVGGEAELCAALDAVRMAPQWAVMLGWHDGPGDDFALREPRGAVDLIARMRTRPGREGPMDRWVIHAGADWTRAHLDDDPADIVRLLAAEAEGALGYSLPPADHLAAHRWLYARTEVALGRPFLRDAEGTLCLGGDWALGDCAGHAWESGAAMASALLEEVG